MDAASISGGGVAGSSKDVKIQNTVIWNNASSALDSFERNVSSCAFAWRDDCAQWLGPIDHSCVEGISIEIFGDTNITDEPYLVGTSVALPATNLQLFGLADASPCLDVGDSTSLIVDIADLDNDGDVGEPIPTDLLGNNRIVGPEIDIGAVEFNGDCDGNGLDDRDEIASGSAFDCNRNGERAKVYLCGKHGMLPYDFDNLPLGMIPDMLAADLVTPACTKSHSSWITVTDAARVLATDVPRYTLPLAKTLISQGCTKGTILTNGKKRTDRRINPISFDASRLKIRDRELDKEDD